MKMCFLVTIEPNTDRCPFENEICPEMHAIAKLTNVPKHPFKY